MATGEKRVDEFLVRGVGFTELRRRYIDLLMAADDVCYTQHTEPEGSERMFGALSTLQDEVERSGLHGRRSPDDVYRDYQETTRIVRKGRGPLRRPKVKR